MPAAPDYLQTYPQDTLLVRYFTHQFAGYNRAIMHFFRIFANKFADFLPKIERKMSLNNNFTTL